MDSHRPYTPSPATVEDTELTPQEIALAVDLFRLIRHAASAINYDKSDPTEVGYATTQRITLSFDERQPRESRVAVTYDSAELSSGYRMIGIGPDLATAFNRVSDDTSFE